MSNKPNFKKEKPLNELGGSNGSIPGYTNADPAVEIHIHFTRSGKLNMQHPEDPMFTVGILLKAIEAVMKAKMQPKTEELVKVVNPLAMPVGAMGRG